MEQKKIIDEINYFMVQKISEMLYNTGKISLVEYNNLTDINRRTFSPLFSELLPQMLDNKPDQS